MSVRVNGVAVDTGDWPSEELAAVHELLRQRAQQLGLLGEGADEAAYGEAIEQLLAREVHVPEPTPEECRRWYDAHPQRYRSGELVHARHILFQVTPGTPVPAIRAVAEAMLKELRAQPELFEARAREKSNCPSGAQGGQLGQLQRGATVPEFEKAVFEGGELGVLPGLVNTRYGFHIVAVDRRIPGEPLPFGAVAERVARELRAAAAGPVRARAGRPGRAGRRGAGGRRFAAGAVAVMPICFQWSEMLQVTQSNVFARHSRESGNDVM